MATRCTTLVSGLLLSFLLSAAVTRADDGEPHNFRPINLQLFGNQRLSNDFHTWPGNNLKLLPRGKQHLGDVDFLIGDKFIQLAGKMAPDFPERVDGIPVGSEVTKLHFFHAVGWTASEGLSVGEYVVHYSDGTVDTVPIEYGLDARDWWVYESEKRATPRAVVAWTGMNHASKNYQELRMSIRLFRRTWENPHPDRKVAAFDYVSRNETATAPFLIAVTAETALKPTTDPFAQAAVLPAEADKKPPAIDQSLPKEAQEAIESLLDVTALLEYDDKQTLIGVAMTMQGLVPGKRRGTGETLEWTSRLTTVEKIDLNSSSIADGDLIPLKKLPKLRWLSLNQTSITNAGLEHLKQIPSLERLRLYSTRVTDEGLSELSQLAKLKILDLSQTQVTDAGLVHLQSLKALEELDLRNTQVTEAAADELRLHLPKAKILTKLRVDVRQNKRLPRLE